MGFIGDANAPQNVNLLDTKIEISNIEYICL